MLNETCGFIIPAEQISCCPGTYTPDQYDNIRFCLFQWAITLTQPAMGALDLKEVYGMDANKELCKWSDLDMVVMLLLDLWHARVVDFNADGEEDKGNDHYWEAFKLQCVRERFRCLYRIDLAAAYVTVGIHDPITPDDQFSGLPVPE